MESDAIKMVVLAPPFACFVLVPQAWSKRSVAAFSLKFASEITSLNARDCGRQEAGKFALKLIWLLRLPAAMQFLRRPRVGAARRRARDRPCERKTRLRIHASANRSLDYNVRGSTPRGGEDAWFHLPIANRNRKPAQNRNDRYILRRSGRIEPAAYSSPARFKIVPMHIQSYSVHSALRDPRFPPRIPSAKYFANIALTTILLCLSSDFNFI